MKYLVSTVGIILALFCVAVEVLLFLVGFNFRPDTIHTNLIPNVTLSCSFFAICFLGFGWFCVYRSIKDFKTDLGTKQMKEESLEKEFLIPFLITLALSVLLFFIMKPFIPYPLII